MTGSRARWNPAVVVLHWVNAALIVALVAVGWAMTHGVFDAGTTFDLYQSHKSLGFLVLALTAVRLGARALTHRPRPVAGLDGEVAAVVQAALYLLTLSAIGAGWLVVSTSPLSVPTRVFGLFVAPDIARPDPALFAESVWAHRLAAYAIAALVALHMASAIKHAWLDRDDTLARMLPRGWRGRPGNP